MAATWSLSASSLSVIRMSPSRNLSTFNLVTETRSSPSTKTRTVPSGNFKSCRIFAIQPRSKRSFAAGSSVSDSFCVKSTMRFSACITSSRAAIDFSRPTKSGTTICGKTTISRRGRMGKRWGSLIIKTSPLKSYDYTWVHTRQATSHSITFRSINLSSNRSSLMRF